MGYLKKVEPVADLTKPTYTFTRAQAQGERGISRRDAPFAIGAIDFGFSPFGDNPAPQAFQDWTWAGRIRTFGHPDRERDKLMAACGGGETQRLVWIHDDGWERVVRARMKSIEWPGHVDDTIYVDAKVTWTILETWRERGPANQLVAGLGTPIVANPIGGGGDVVAGTQTFPVAGAITPNAYVFPTNTTPVADASVAGVGGIPNVADTAPVINAVGPLGGDFGFILYGYAATILDAGGNAFNPQIGVEMFIPPGANCRIDCGAQMITVDGAGDVTNLKYKPDAQPYWFIVKEGQNNGIGIAANGLNGINYYQPVSIIPTGGLYPTAGSFQLVVTPPGHTAQTTSTIPFNSTPAFVANLLRFAAGIDVPANVRVTAYLDPGTGYYYNANGSPGYNVMFVGALAGVTVPTMTSVSTLNHGTVSIATIYGSLSLAWTRKYR